MTNVEEGEVSGSTVINPVQKSRQKNKPDPKRLERVVRYTDERKITLEYDIHSFDIIGLLIMIVSITGVSMNWKSACWASVVLSFFNIGNARWQESDLKQILSGIFISASATFMMYLKDPTPICDWSVRELWE